MYNVGVESSRVDGVDWLNDGGLGKDGREKGQRVTFISWVGNERLLALTPGADLCWAPRRFQPFAVGSQDRDLTPLSLNRSKHASSSYNIPIDRGGAIERQQEQGGTLYFPLYGL